MKVLELKLINWSRQPLIVLLALGCFSGLFYGDTLKNGYSIDDQYMYTENSIANNGLNNVTAIFQKSSLEYKGSKRFSYRPITILSFAVENHLFGVNSTISHLINLLLYCFVCFLIYLVLRKLFPECPHYLAFLTGLLFLIFPIHTEIANNVKCRDELLLLLFGLLGIYFWLKDQNRILNKTMSIFFILLSILCKKTGLLFVGFIPLAVFFQSKGNWKRSFLTLLGMITPLFLWRLVFKLAKEGKSVRNFTTIENPLYGSGIPYEKLTIVFESLWFYVKSLFLPVNFSAYYGYNTIEVLHFNWITILGGIFLLLVGILAFYKLKNTRPVSFGAVIVLIGLVPFLNIWIPVVGIVAERFATIASLGWSIVIVYGIHQFVNKFKATHVNKIALACFLLFGMYSFTTIRSQNKNWESENSIILSSLETYPYNVVLSKTLGTNYNQLLKKEKNPKKRIELSKEMLRINKLVDSQFSAFSTCINIASLEMSVNRDYKAAETYLLKALKHDPKSFLALKVLYDCYLKQNDKANQLKTLKRIVIEHPQQNKFYPLLYNLVKQSNNLSERVEWNTLVVERFPDKVELILK